MTTVKCNTCHKEYDIDASDAQLSAWRGGQLIQNAMPHLTPDMRELLISGVCGPCFDAMFPAEVTK